MSELFVDTVKTQDGTKSISMTNVVDNLAETDVRYVGASKSYCSVNTSSFSVLSSYNISSVTDAGAGLIEPNMANAMASGDYSVAMTAYPMTFTNHACGWSYSASTYYLRNSSGTSGYSDTAELSGQVDGDLA